MKRNKVVNRWHFIHRHAQHILTLGAIVILLLLMACGGGQASTPELTTEPVETTITAPTPTLAQPTSTQLPATATMMPTETAAATAIPPTATENSADGATDLVTYEDSVSTFALDYPAAWHVVDVAQEFKTASTGYTISFLSWQPDTAGSEGIPAGETVLEANALPKGITSLEEAAGELKQSLGPGESIISEQAITLDSGLPAVRWTLQTSAGPTYVLLAVIVDRPLMLRGWGEEALFDLIAGSLRATYTQANDAERIVIAPGATSATIKGSFSGQSQARYLFWAAAGQVVSLSVTSPQNSVLFHLEGVDDGQVYKHLLDGENSWQGSLTVSQDYLLTVDNSDIPAHYTIELSIVDS